MVELTQAARIALGGSALLILYPYIVYPALLRILGRLRSPSPLPPDWPGGRWPSVTVAVPVFNEERQIRGLLESLSALEYPGDLQILIVSDASDDGTDRIVRECADPRIELLRTPARVGKTGAENFARPHLRGEIIVNTDASIRIRPGALLPLVSALRDPQVGVASGRDVSVIREGGEGNEGETGYVGYEMWVRGLENRVGGIVGSSGCLYAIRRELHDLAVPAELSRDFISALNAREAGFRAVSVNEALCEVPRTASLMKEYRRKVRTLTRGMATLLYKRRLLNPFRYGLFSWMLLSHKVGRWTTPWALLLGVIGIALLAPSELWGRVALGAIAVGAAMASVPWIVEWRTGGGRTPPPILGILAYAAGGSLAALHALVRVLRGRSNPVWEPTRRELLSVSRAAEGG